MSDATAGAPRQGARLTTDEEQIAQARQSAAACIQHTAATGQAGAATEYAFGVYLQAIARDLARRDIDGPMGRERAAEEAVLLVAVVQHAWDTNAHTSTLSRSTP